jgi:hypothetical protein
MSIRAYTTDSLGSLFVAGPKESDSWSTSYSSGNISDSSFSYSGRPGGVKRRSRKVKKVKWVPDYCLAVQENGFPWLGNRDLEWADRGWTARYMLQFWRERCLVCPCSYCDKEKRFWLLLGKEWGWDSHWSLKVDRRDSFWECLDADPLFVVSFPANTFPSQSW